MAFLKAVLKFLGYYATFYSILLLLFIKGIPKLKGLKNKEFSFFTNNKKSFIIVALVIFILYMPYFLSQYPGIISTDSIAEISTSLESMNQIVNHYPVFHIVIVAIFMNIGKVLHNYTLGIGLYSIFQMICTACVFSFMLYYMAKRNVNFYIRAICFAIVALYPPFACYAITMWKDVPFGLVMILYTISMIEIAINKEFLTRMRNKIFLVLSMILVILFRNNGIYVVILSIPFMIFFTKGKRKTMSVLSAIVILFYILWKGPIFSLFNITDGPIREALSVPLQQIARTVKYRGSELTEEEKKQINQYLPVDQLEELYYPLISDRVKDTLNNEAVQENKLDFITIWAKLLIQYPREYVESFLSGSYGYWYPEAKNWVIWMDGEQTFINGSKDLKIEMERKPIINSSVMDKMIYAINYTSFPVISAIFSIGFVFWCTGTMLMYVIYKKKYKLILAYIPVMFLWLTTIASPVWCEYRYIYSIFTCAPLLIISITNFIPIDEENKIIQKEGEEKVEK